MLFRLAPLFVLGLLAAISCQQERPLGRVPFFETLAPSRERSLSSLEDSIDIQNITLRKELLQPGDTLFGLIKTDSIFIVINKKDSTLNKISWQGQVINAPLSAANFILYNGVFVGNIKTGIHFYQIRQQAEGNYTLQKVNQSVLEDGDDVNVNERGTRALNNNAPATSACPNEDSPYQIDVMVLYTPEARAAAGGTDNIQAEVLLAVEETNISYENSQVHHRIQLVQLEEYAVPEIGNFQVRLLSMLSDPYVQAQRDRYAADLVVLITQKADGNTCGRAFAILDPVRPDFESKAYCLVRRACASGNYSFGHEIGHLMGCRHEHTADRRRTPFPFAHGHKDCEKGFRSMMAQRCPAFAERSLYWSNPNVTFEDIATGVREEPFPADNCRVLNHTAFTVANFRCRTAPKTDHVWIKDHWEDAGAEPGEAAESVWWDSPDIWIRNARDPQFQYQHEHQEPQKGGTNWVYVKLRNAGGQTQGNLELWATRRSLSSEWSKDWQRVAVQPVRLAAHSTQIVEIPETPFFANPLENYTLLAKWVSPDDVMTTPESKELHKNIQQNNNIAYKNVISLDLVNARNAAAVFPIELANYYALELKFPSNSFVNWGEVEVAFDVAGRGGRIQAQGAEATAQQVFRITSPERALFTFYNFAPGMQGQLKISFTRNEGTPINAYPLDIILHKNINRPGERMVGGMRCIVKSDFLESIGG